MGDPINVFGGWSGVKHLSAREIEKMKKNMKRVPEIQLKSDIYHSQEITEAEWILWKIDTPTQIITEQPTETQQTDWHPSRIKLLRQRFISLF
jgi:hypothetical protein